MAFIYIPESLRSQLLTPYRLDLGSYTHWGSEPNREQMFIVELDAGPLFTLVQEAALSCRVYELLTINRIGDVLHYLRVRPIDVEDDVANIFSGKKLKGQYRFLAKSTPENWGSGYWPLVDFDAHFGLYDDDTPPAHAQWRDFWETGSWQGYVGDLLKSVRAIQSLLREADDDLIALEIARMDNGVHHQEYLPFIDRDCRILKRIPDEIDLPKAIFDLIEELIASDQVQSVACPFDGFWIWRLLFEEQLKRSAKTHTEPQQAFSLSCADSTQVLAPFSAWGAELHRPYEGYCGADLFIKPKWRKVFPEHDREGGSLSDIVFYTGEIIRCGYVCHYLLTDDDLGELKCATRRVIGDGWVLYENKRPYQPNPNFKKPQTPQPVDSDAEQTDVNVDYVPPSPPPQPAVSVQTSLTKVKLQIPVFNNTLEIEFSDDLLKALQHAQHVVVLSGAGMSAESGIRTFRDAQTGLWEQYDPHRLASVAGYEADKALVWGWYEWRRMQVLKAQPHDGHYAVAALAQLVKKLTLITQNVDDLHERAGSDHIIHLHGSLHQPRCSYCDNPYQFPEGIPNEPDGGRRLEPPHCQYCNNTIRPGVVWFGESLPQTAWKLAQQAARACDVIFSIGTSAMVWPAAQLPEMAKLEGATVIQINPDSTGLDSQADYNFKGKAGEIMPALANRLSAFIWHSE